MIYNAAKQTNKRGRIDLATNRQGYWYITAKILVGIVVLI